MIKVYGMPSCPDCAWVKPQLDDRFEYIDIGSHVRLLKEFIDLRDHRKEFDRLKSQGDLCIPCFVKEDGQISFRPEDFGLTSKPDNGESCSIDHKGNC